MKKESEIQELYYERAKSTRRLSALLFDAFCCFALFFLLLLGTFPLLSSFSFVRDAKETREELGLNSGLYVQKEGDTILLTDSLEEEDLDLDEKSLLLDQCLTSFYQMETFFPEGDPLIYPEDKEEACSLDEKKMFEDGERILLNDDYDQEYYDFYEESFLVARGYLQKNKDYLQATRTTILSYAIGIVLTFLLPFPLFFLLFPLLFKRTRQTLGMKLTRIGLLGADGLALSTKKVILRFLFLFFVEVVLSLCSFLLPLFVSVGMLLLSKSHQSLHDYVCNTYCVSLEDVTIYLDKDEYRLSKETKKEGMGLEDPRYRPVSGVDHEVQ